MLIVQTSTGHKFLIDTEDLTYFQSRNWGAHDTGYGIYLSYLECGHRIYFHRKIKNAPNGVPIDHIDGNTFNLQKVNLILSSHSLNGHNKLKYKTNTSGYKGVSKSGRINLPWQAKIDINNRQISLGRHYTKIEAARAYDKASFAYIGFSRALNFPEDFT